jgi:hypothetical protein
MIIYEVVWFRQLEYEEHEEDVEETFKCVDAALVCCKALNFVNDSSNEHYYVRVKDTSND